MRLLQINSGHLFGGIESFQLTHARERELYPALEMEYAFCFPGKIVGELLQYGVAVHDLGAVRSRYPWTVWRARRALQNLLEARSYDAVACQGMWSYAIFAPVAHKYGTPVALWLHDPVRRRFDWLSRWAQQTQPDLVLCNSGYVASGLHNFFTPSKTRSTVLYCPVSTPPPRIPAAERASIRQSFDTPPDACVTLQVSRLDPHKGHLLHVEALGKLRDVPNWVCWQVAGPQRPHEFTFLEQIKETARRAGIADRIRFLGWQPDVWKLFGSADIFCQPNSAPEPFGLTYVEALWSGLPVVATAMGGALEIVEPSCGILTPPGDSTALAAALKTLITDRSRREGLGAAGPARAEQLCSPREHFMKLHEALQTITREHARSPRRQNAAAAV